MDKMTELQAEKTELTKSSKKERSTAYPAHDLEESIDAVCTLHNKLGKGPFDRDSAAKALGYKGVSGASAVKISACAQFGLLMRSGNAYYISDLARKIITPVSEDERLTAILEAVKTPSLYSSLVSEYSGRALPTMLDNVLSRNYGIIEKSTKKAVETFRSSLEYADLLKNGVVQSETSTLQEKRRDIDSSIAASTLRNDGGPVTPVDAMELDLPGVDAKLILSKKYTFALSMGELANEIKDLRNALSRLAKELEGVDDENKKE